MGSSLIRRIRLGQGSRAVPAARTAVLALQILLPMTALAVESQFVALRSTQSGEYVRAGVGPDSHLAAVSPHVKAWETFVWVDLTNNLVVLRSAHSGKFVRAGVGPDSHLAAASDRADAWELFRKKELGGGKVALRSIQNGKFVRAGVGPDSHLAAVSSHVDRWETFQRIEVPGWRFFAHPEKPHLDLRNPDLPIVQAPLFRSEAAEVQLPVLVVLLDFPDLGAQPAHTPAYFADMVFGQNRANGRPSVAETYRENSNGRLSIVPATAGDRFGAEDGIVGWVTARNQAGCCRNTKNDGVKIGQAACQQQGFVWQPGTAAYYGCYIEEKRAEGVLRADPFFDYARYRGDDGVIAGDELAVLVINAAPEFGGNARVTDPPRVGVEGGQLEVYQLVTGVTEQAHVGLLAHELGHQSFGLGDLYEVEPNTHVADGYTRGKNWFPPDPQRYSLMGGGNPASFLSHLDPWAKLHLGFIKPLVTSHDGSYTLHDIETERSVSTQTGHPEALIVYDPLRPDLFEEYFLLENRDRLNTSPGGPAVLDRGLAVWLINEEGSNLRQIVRLVRRGGHWAGELQSLWDGGSPGDGYDLTATSVPRDTRWTDGSDSRIDIYDFSPAGKAITFKIRTRPPMRTWASSGTSSDLDAYRSAYGYSLPGVKRADEIVGLAVAGSDDHVYAWYRDGTVSSGTSSDLDAYRQPFPYTLPAGKSVADIVGLAIAGSDDHVYAWYRDGTVSSGTNSALDAYSQPYPYTLPAGKSTADIVGLAIAGSDDHVYAWYRDGTVSSGTSSDLDAYRQPYSYSRPGAPISAVADLVASHIAGLGIARDDHIYVWSWAEGY